MNRRNFFGRFAGLAAAFGAAPAKPLPRMEFPPPGSPDKVNPVSIQDLINMGIPVSEDAVRAMCGLKPPVNE